MLRICLFYSVLLLLGVQHDGCAYCALCSLVRLLIARTIHAEIMLVKCFPTLSHISGRLGQIRLGVVAT